MLRSPYRRLARLPVTIRTATRFGNRSVAFNGVRRHFALASAVRHVNYFLVRRCRQSVRLACRPPRQSAAFG